MELGLKKSEVEREGKILASLDHVNIVKQKVWFFEGMCFYSVMEKIEGETLSSYFAKTKFNGGLLKEELILKILFQLISFLKYLKGKNLLHRDLKTSNIMISNDLTKIKVLDFGLSKLLSSPKSLAKSLAGTKVYMSPQCIFGECYSFETDVWSLGIILYELLTLELPFDVSDPKELKFLVRSGYFHPITSDVSPELIKLVSLMLQPDPNQRIGLDRIEQELNALQKKRMVDIQIKSIFNATDFNSLQERVQLSIAQKTFVPTSIQSQVTVIIRLFDREAFNVLLPLEISVDDFLQIVWNQKYYPDVSKHKFNITDGGHYFPFTNSFSQCQVRRNKTLYIQLSPR